MSRRRDRRRRGPCGRGRRDAGTVTAELAIGMVAVCVVLAALCSVVVVGVAQVRVSDAASAGARLAARGEGTEAVGSAAARLGGAGASVSVRPGGGMTEVTVTRSVPLLLPGSPAVRVESRALAVAEERPAVGGAAPQAPGDP